MRLMMLLSKNKFEYIRFKGHMLAENWKKPVIILLGICFKLGKLLQIWRHINSRSITVVTTRNGEESVTAELRGGQSAVLRGGQSAVLRGGQSDELRGGQSWI